MFLSYNYTKVILGIADTLERLKVAQKFKVKIKKKARKSLDGIPKDIKDKIDEKIKRLADDPWRESEGKMEGYDNRHKFRQGGWRVIYEIDDDEVKVDVIKIDRRGQVYKKK